MPCVICGDPITVKSHILPRALFHDMKRGVPIIGPRRDGGGYQTLQSGGWDDQILCERHEAALGLFDTAGVTFCRDHAKAVGLTPNAAFRDIPIKSAETLISFACACVWRRATSEHMRSGTELLGPYDGRLRRRLFEGDSSWEPELAITRHQIRDAHGAAMNLVIVPTPWRIAERHFWRFSIHELIFDLKFDQRPTPASADLFPVNGQTVATVWVEPPTSVMDIPGLVGAIIEMSKRPKSPKRVYTSPKS
jgi:hypothetical protein